MSRLTPSSTGPMLAILLCQLASLSAQMVINEIHYHPGRGQHDLEFVELYNTGTESTDLSLWSLTDAVRFKIPEGTNLAPKGFLVLAADPEAVAAAWGIRALGPWEGRLSNEGETLVLRDAVGVEKDIVDYGAGFPWPVASAGAGASMELIHPKLDNDLAGSWRASAEASRETGEPVVFISSEASDWSYRPAIDEASNPPDAWRRSDFKLDESWRTGRAPFGYGDGDDHTLLAEMPDRYTGLFLRHSFTIPQGRLPSALLLRLYSDDGALIWINGTLVVRVRAPLGELRHDALATESHEAAWEEFVLKDCQGYLVEGDNILAVQGLNRSRDSSDFSLDVELRTPDADSMPFSSSPGRSNASQLENPPPQIRQVEHVPAVGRSGEPMTIRAKVTDPDGVKEVVLECQFVKPGHYIALDDDPYEADWVAFPMNDTGDRADETKGDDVYTVRLPGERIRHRWLIRYRIRAVDQKDASVQVPYADDPQPNFASFCYDGVPAWTAADRPGVTEAKTFSRELMNAVPVVHLIANEEDVMNSQYVRTYNERYFPGTLVNDGRVYDHIQFRNRGETTTYMTGKNKWRFRFNRTHEWLTEVPYGPPDRRLRWERMNLNPGTMPYRPEMRGSASLNERLTFRLYQLAGCPAPDTRTVQFRVIDLADETGRDQYHGDLWGIYMQFNAVDGDFLDNAELPDGEIHKMAQSGAYTVREPLSGGDAGNADFRAFLSDLQLGQDEAWWREQVNLEHYFSYHAISIATARHDQKLNHNHYLYRHPELGWMPIPWDADLSLQPQHYREGDYRWQTQFKYALNHPALRVAYQSRVRELIDLLFQRDEMEKLVGILGRELQPFEGESLAEVDQFLWNHHPLVPRSHRGTFFQNPVPAGGQWDGSIRFDAEGIEGRMAYFVDFLSPDEDHRRERNALSHAGWAVRLLKREAEDPRVPPTPIVSGDPFQPLTFRWRPGMGRRVDLKNESELQWRVAEVSDPGDHEIQAAWEWQGAADSTEVRIPDHVLTPGSSCRVRVRIGDQTGRWSHWSRPVTFTAPEPAMGPYQDAMALSEIMYHPLPSATAEERAKALEPSDFEFIELYHRGDRALSLEPLTLRGGVRFDFRSADRREMLPGDRLLLVRNRQAFLARYPAAADSVLGEWEDGKLSNGGERIAIEYGNALTVISLNYDDKAPWPREADGKGYSLEWNDEEKPLDDPSAWRASKEMHGSPGR